MANSELVKSDLSVEVIDSEVEFRRLIIGNWCAIYCIEGVVKFLFEADKSIRLSEDHIESNSTFSGAWLR